MKRQTPIVLTVLLVLLTSVAPTAWAQQTESDVAATHAEFGSPQAAMFTFLDAMNRVAHGEENAWEQALASLDQSQTDPDHLRTAATNLKEVLDRLGTVTREELPDAAAVQARRLTRFRYFPRQSVHDWVNEALGGWPEEKIVLEKSADGSWKFSAATVASIGALYDRVEHLQYKHVDEHPVMTTLGPTFEKTPWWSWASLLAMIFFGLLAGKIMQAIFRGMGQRLENRGWSARATIFNDIASPASLALLTLGLTIGLSLIYMENAVREFTDRILAFLYILALGWFIYNLVDLMDIGLRQLTTKTQSKLDDQIVPLIRKSLRVFIVIIFTLFVAQNVFGVNITAWIAGLGIAGLAVSLAAQDSIKNLFGSITILCDHPFAVGDRIMFDGSDGTVEEIGFRSTKIRTLVGHLVTVPNMKFIDNKVENVTARPFLRRILDVTITYDTPAEKVEQAVQIIRDILAQPRMTEPFDMENLPPRVFFNEYNAASLNIRVMYWYTLKDGRDWWTYNAYCEDFNHQLLCAYTQAGIEFAFPTQTLYLAGDPNRELAVKKIEGN